jgi:adenylyltransferase/sulfurtransferase
VLNAIVSAVASIQVADGMKLLCRQQVRHRITTFDVWSGVVRQIDMPARDAECPACGRREFPALTERGRVPAALCGRNAVQIHDQPRPIDLGALRTRLEPLAEVRSNEFVLRFFPKPYELTVFPDGRVIVKGTSDIGVARSLYARYLG